MKKRIAIVDAQEAVRELLGHYLGRLSEYEIVGQARTGLDAMRLGDRTCAGPNPESLTDWLSFGGKKRPPTREIEVMQSIAEGKSNKEIAVLLGVATKTVDNHRSRLMQKLGIHNAASLTLAAIQMGFVPLSTERGDLFQGSLRSEKSVSQAGQRSRDLGFGANGHKEHARGTIRRPPESPVD